MAEIHHSQPWITTDDMDAVASALANRTLAQGSLTREFESAFAHYHGFPAAIAASSGTAALVIALRSLGLEKDSEVVLPTYVCRSVWDAVVEAGCRPILCDIGPEWCITPDTVEAAWSVRTRAVIVVHTFGIVADIADMPSGATMIEDCCQSLGARGSGGRAGTIGDIAIFSFHATKLLTTGEGGMAASRDPLLCERMRTLKTDAGGLKPRLRAPLSDMQAALGLSQLRRYEDFLARRRDIADRYFESLGPLGAALPHAIRDRTNFFRFPLRIRADFDEVRAAFAERGIHIRRGVDALLHRAAGMDAGSFPNAEACFASTASIPLYPALSDADVEQVVEACLALRRFFREA